LPRRLGRLVKDPESHHTLLSPGMLGIRKSAAAGPAEDAAEDAANDLAPDLAADGPGGLLGERFRKALPALAAPDQLPEPAAPPRLCPPRPPRPPRRRPGIGGARGLAPRAPREDLVRGLAIHAGVVLGAHRTARPHRRALLGGDRPDAASGRRNPSALDRHRH